VAWSFGALWFDFPIAAFSHTLAIVFFCGALAVLVLIRPRWRAKLGLVIGIALIAAWWLTIRPSTNLNFSQVSQLGVFPTLRTV
jgi:hypothetical protein